MQNQFLLRKKQGRVKTSTHLPGQQPERGPWGWAADGLSQGRSRPKSSLGERSSGRLRAHGGLWRTPVTSRQECRGLARSCAPFPRPSRAGMVTARGRAGAQSLTAAATLRALLGYRRVHSGAASGNTRSTRPPGRRLRDPASLSRVGGCFTHRREG